MHPHSPVTKSRLYSYGSLHLSNTISRNQELAGGYNSGTKMKPVSFSYVDTLVHHHHHHQSLLPPMGHRAPTMSLFHRVFSFAIACASPHDKPISLRSVSTVFLQVVLGLSLFLLPAGVHLRAISGILSGGNRNTCPSHLSRHFLISKSILEHPVFLCRVLLEILLGQKMLQILHKQPL